MIDLFNGISNIGIFGPTKSGKSTLAHIIAHHLFKTQRRQGIALVPHDADTSGWGMYTRVYRDKDQFLDFARTAEGCLISIEDASSTIKADKDVTDLFTCMRHRKHMLMVMGHHASNLTPQMRDQLERVFLFLQNEEIIKYWKIQFPGQPLEAAVQLKQYEFVTVANYRPMLKSKVTPMHT